ncbi:unnamed protein product [Diatraea saccharalis]|uniref:Uncharacterized protein n=1 Tax=Diatraea saccharalis TaxID=40085 RepID=A0A9N9RAJ8_9NEOP|nr:unnamed protein product [Diatraea saccharalis]
MDTWSELCRCCLSSNCTISLFDADQIVKLKFIEITTIKIKDDDGLPQKLCADCYDILESACEFKKQCLKMDVNLKRQLNELINLSSQAKSFDDGTIVEEDNDIANDPVKQLEAIIKPEPTDSDDDCYYVLVIDDNNVKDTTIKEEPEVKLPKIKVENVDTIGNKDTPEPNITNEIILTDKENDYENTFKSFLVSNTKVPVNVPATILENEEESQDNDDESQEHDNEIQENYNEIEENDNERQEHNNFNMDVDTQDSNSQEHTLQEKDDATNYPDHVNDNAKSLIKILTTNNSDGTIFLKDANGIEYLADSLITSADGEQLDQEEVIFCEGDETSQFQILKVIEYTDDSQIATVLQQDDGTFLCDCGEECKDLSEFEKHQRSHILSNVFLCNLCGKGFETEEILTGHTLLHNMTGLLVKCPFCEQVFRRNSLTQHIKHTHNHIRPRCDVCMKTFANTNNLKRHMMIHSGLREFECDICCKRFHQKITMQTHRLTHVNPYSCNQCDETFIDKELLTSHKESGQCNKSKLIKVKNELMKTVKQEVTTTVGKLLGYACSLCKKMFSLESALEQHVEQTHILNIAELLCAECGIVLPTKKEMQNHLASHKNLKPKQSKRFECRICGKGCTSQAMLIMHERVHTNERPFPCQLCSLRFKTKTHLRTHQLTHTREKKFGCSVCMKFFALKGNLVVHLRTHTGERPYVCSICGEAFIDSKYLKKHKLKKHSIENVPWNQYTQSNQE